MALIGLVWVGGFGLAEERPKDSVFDDMSGVSGLDFTHFNGMTGRYYFPEMTGQGGGLLDYDGDGDLDVYLVQGALLGSTESMADALYPPSWPGTPSDQLFRNDSFLDSSGELQLRFVDVTSPAGIEATGYGMGLATGDIDGDGWLDIYVTNYGPNQLLRNRGDGTFEDVTAKSGTGDPMWGSSAVFFDYDDDGDQDLYVANYVEFDVDVNPRCFATSSRLDYCGPDAFRGQPDRLYRNEGDGRFMDVTSRVLTGYQPGPGLGVAVADFNGDQRIDLYVANDGQVNQLWINQGDGTFIDEALFAGVGLNQRGRPEASMGVDAADFDGDGDVDIFLTHLMGESNTLYVNDGTALFEDRTIEHGLASLSLPYTSFGTSWIDFDNDGLLDLLAANGAVRILEDQAAAGDPYPLRQPNQLFRNTGSKFVDVSDEAGEGFSALEVSRGVSLGDVDNDGDHDLVIHTNNGAVRLLINRSGDRNPWLGVGVRTGAASVWEVGSRVLVVRTDGTRAWRRTRTDGSYCSSKDPRSLIGLAEGGEPASLTVHHPGRTARSFVRPPRDRYLVVYDSQSQ
jgi:hypothetical protein